MPGVLDAGPEAGRRRAARRQGSRAVRVVVVESPAKARTLARCLGRGYKVLACYGHVSDLPAKAGSVNPDEGFAMRCESAGRRAARALGAIRSALEDADALVLATDPDREGEAIAWQVLEWLAVDASRGVEEDHDRPHRFGMHRREVQARVDEPAVRLAPGVVAFGRVGHVAAEQRSPIQRAGVGALNRLLDLGRHLSLGAGDVERLVHGLVPGLLLGGDVHRRLGAIATVACAGVGVHDLPGAGRIVARRSIGRTLVAFVVAVLALAVPVLVVSVLAVGLAVAVLVLTVLVAGGIGQVTGVLVLGVGRGLAVGRIVGPGGTGRCVGVVPGVVGARLGQTVVCLLDAHVLPGFGVRREREAGVANERMGDELRGQLPALGVALAPARVVLQGAGHDHARHRGLDEVRIGVANVHGPAAIGTARGWKLLNAPHVVRVKRKLQTWSLA